MWAQSLLSKTVLNFEHLVLALLSGSGDQLIDRIKHAASQNISIYSQYS